MSVAYQPRPAGNVYGRIVSGADVEQAALATLRKWAPRYIAEVERQRGREPCQLPEPRGYIVASQFGKWPEDQMPVAIVISPGWAERPRRDGEGIVMAKWSLAVGVVSHAVDQESTRTNGLDYIAAFRTLITQQQSLGGLALTVDCFDESYTVIPYQQSRSLFAAQALFVVTVENSFAYGRGPGGRWGPPLGYLPDPCATEAADWPEAERHRVGIRPVPVDETLADQDLTFAEE